MPNKTSIAVKCPVCGSTERVIKSITDDAAAAPSKPDEAGLVLTAMIASKSGLTATIIAPVIEICKKCGAVYCTSVTTEKIMNTGMQKGGLGNVR